MFEYSIVIRTTGRAGQKYARLLETIEALLHKPKEVIVVLPENYELPKERLGYETFYFCPKGMVKQRLYGIEVCKTRYALVTDDDIAFSPDFINKVSIPVVNGSFGLSSGPLIEFFPNKGKQSFFAAITGAAIPTFFHKERYNTVLKNTGYSYNRNIKTGSGLLYETQSAAWTCFFADLERLKSIHFEDEIWLDKYGFSAHDDTAMFYKAWIYGIKTVIVADAKYEHLNAKTSTKGISKAVAFASSFNTYIFWRRFIYENNSFIGKIKSVICFYYTHIIGNFVSLLRDNKDIHKLKVNGHKTAKMWIKSDEYKNLKPFLY